MNCSHGVDIDEYDCHECKKDISDFWERDNLKTITTIHILTTGKFNKFQAQQVLSTIRKLVS